jgi:ParB family chromosome partitioning protein
MASNQAAVVQMIPVASVRVLNPRSRNRHLHAVIINNIRGVGLRKPITVSRSGGGTQVFDLVCGQGRLEAYQALGQTMIPAVIKDLSEQDCMLMSLVENIARRHRPSAEAMAEIGRLADRGHDEAQIAAMVGASESWVRSILGLLRNGEERLLSAVDAGTIPISLATEIAKAESKDVQKLLAEVCARGDFRGKKLLTLRRLLEAREKGQKSAYKHDGGKDARKSGGRRSTMTPTRLRQLVEREASRHRLAVKKAELAHTCLVVATEAFADLLGQPEFVSLLESAGCPTIPRALADRLRAEVAP